MSVKIAKSTKKFMPKNASSFWMDESVFDYNMKSVGKDYVKLAGYQRAIANFVKILTGKNIPVTYAEKGNSYTDGKHVVISSRIEEKEFDSTVGLALHEGSHILLTDFSVLTTLSRDLKDLMTPEQRKYASSHTNGDNWFIHVYMCNRVKDLINIVEDRRIDMYVYKNAPGYQLYYKALYDKYFNSPVIDKALRSTSYRSEDWESYMFRVINITNPNRDLTALKYLKAIYECIDLSNISRLSSTRDVVKVAFDIFWIIEMACANKETASIPKPQKAASNASNAGNGNSGAVPKPDLKPVPKSDLEQAINSVMNSLEDEDESEDTDDIENSNDFIPTNNNDDIDSDIDEDADWDDTITAEDTTPGDFELTPNELNKLSKDKESQERFVRGEVNKSKLSKTDSRMVKAMSESESSVEDATVDKLNPYDTRVVGVAKIPVLVVRNVTPFVINSGVYNDVFMSDESSWNRNSINHNLHEIQAGIILGTKLGKKLKIRNEERDTKFTRLKSGAIDKRLIASLGYGAEAVFHKMERFSYNPMYFHLSLDASGSMSGARYDNCLRLAAAIAKAADMVGNIRVVIDIRTTTAGASGHKPIVAVLYDSKRDPLSKMVYNLSHSMAGGVTPEGLCFDVIMKDIIKGSQSTDAIFFNMSDGEPNFEGNGMHYKGATAESHTKKQVTRMIKSNIQVISYFISTYGEDSRSFTTFKTMYGNNAHCINTGNILELSRTINERMLQK